MGRYAVPLGEIVRTKIRREKWIDEEASTWKPGLREVKATIDFAKKTGRFETEMCAKVTGSAYATGGRQVARERQVGDR